MKQKCIRCSVQVSLAELRWETVDGDAVHLEGPPVFVRVCVLGQLQHTCLHRPLFPLKLNQQLSFDRILTNCRTPSLFSEVIRGEHVKVELIQVSADYKGGKVLACFEAPVHGFLFPKEDQLKGTDLREVQLSQSRKYQCPPSLSFTTSTSLFEATVISPVDSMFQQQDKDHERTHCHTDDTVYDTERELSLSALGSGRHGNMKTTPRRLYGSTTQMRKKTREPLSDPQASYPLLQRHSAPIGGEREESSTQTKLHSLLNSYTNPPPICTMFKEGPPRKVRLKPPVPKFVSRETLSNSTAPQCNPKSTSFSTTNVPTFPTPATLRYTSVSAGVGPHSWRECPRRQSPGKRWRPSHRSASAPGFSVLSHRKKWGVWGHSSRSLSHWRSTTLPNRVPLEALSLERTDPLLSPRRTAPTFRPPFVVRRTDSRMLERRNFCGSHGVGAARHFNKEERQTRGGEEAREEDVTPASLSRASSTSTEEPVTTNVPTLSELYNQYLHRAGREQQPEARGKHTSVAYTDQPHPRPHLSPLNNSLTSSLTHTTPPPLPRQHHHTHSPSYSPTMTSLGRNDVSGQDLVAKYLMVHPGNERGSSVQNPSKLIEEKLRQLKEDCCEYKTSESLGEDDLTEDLDRLRASLAAERDETMNRTARLLPDQSVMVKLGPQDYWSQQMSAFTGRPHRVLFDETMEKIYSRLYQEASQLH